MKRLKALKRKEIQDRIEKIKTVTGNTKVGFDLADLDEDFNPEEHDRKMNEVFDKEFYGVENDVEPPAFEDEGVY